MKSFLKSLRGRVLILRRKPVVVVAGLLIAAIILYAVTGPAFVGAAATERKLPIYCVERDDKTVSLSFDAAWGNG